MKVKVWGVMEGPIAVEEIEDNNIPIDSNYFLICKSEIDGVMGEDNFWFEDYDSAYEWKKHFMKSIDPLVVDMPDDFGYN